MIKESKLLDKSSHGKIGHLWEEKILCALRMRVKELKIIYCNPREKI